MICPSLSVNRLESNDVLHSVHLKQGLWNVFPDAFTCSAKYTGLEHFAHSGVDVPGIARAVHPPPVAVGLSGLRVRAPSKAMP